MVQKLHLSLETSARTRPRRDSSHRERPPGHDRFSESYVLRPFTRTLTYRKQDMLRSQLLPATSKLHAPAFKYRSAELIHIFVESPWVWFIITDERGSSNVSEKSFLVMEKRRRCSHWKSIDIIHQFQKWIDTKKTKTISVTHLHAEVKHVRVKKWGL